MPSTWNVFSFAVLSWWPSLRNNLFLLSNVSKALFSIYVELVYMLSVMC